MWFHHERVNFKAMYKFIFLFLSILLMQSCMKEDSITNKPLDIELLSVDYTGCNETKSLMLDGASEKIVVSAVDQNIYQLEHQNATFNCCLPEGLEVKVYVGNDTIFFCDDEKVAGNCRCMCSYNTLLEIGGVEEGNYVLCIISGAKCLGSVELNFKNEMFEEVLVSELTDN